MKFLFCILLTGGAVVTAAPFSHRVHLQLKLECVKCHAAAPASTRVEDNLLPAKTVCLGCHKDSEVQIPAPPSVRIVKFSHAQHLKMGNVAPVIAAAMDKKDYLQPAGDIRAHLNKTNPCEACHRGLAESDQVSHAALPQMADCLVCHNQIDNPFSCETCHEKNNTAALKPSNHTPDFLDTHTSGKLSLDKTTCAVCHGRTFHCLGCH